MDMVERVARGICDDLARQDGDKWKLPADMKLAYLDQGEVDFSELAKAAIRAMLEGLEPFAYRYFIKPPEAGMGKTIWRTCRDLHLIDDGWTETPLYDLSALKEVVG